MAFMRGDLVTKTMKAVKANIIDKPVWLDAVLSVPPQMVRPRGIRAKRIRLPEDPYVESYYARHPEADCTPFELNSFDPPPARKFAWRQLEIMKKMKIKNRKLARDIVEAEWNLEGKLQEEHLRAERRKAIREGRTPPPLKKSMLQQVQEEEMKHLLNGLKRVRDHYRNQGISCVIPFEDAVQSRQDIGSSNRGYRS